MLEDTFVMPSDPRLNVSVPTGEIDIETQPGPDASVRLTPLADNEASREAVERAKVELHGNELVVEVKHKRLGLSGRAQVRAEIRCPDGTDTRVHTASGDVQVRGRLGDAKAHVASGDVRLERIDGRLQAHSASGDFEVAFVRDDASIHSASGDITIRRSDAGVNIQSASGDVEVLDAGGGPVKVKSASGDVRIGVRAGRRVAVDVRTVSGNASSEIPLDGGEAAAADAPLVEIQVNGVSGDVRIERAVEVEAA